MINLYFEDIHNQKNFIQPDEVTKSGADRITTSAWANQLKRQLAYTEAANDLKPVLDFFGKSYEINIFNDIDSHEGKYLVPIGINESPHEWIGGEYSKTDECKNFKHLFDIIPEKILQHARERRAYIMFDNSLEGYHDDYILTFFWENAASRYIPPEQIIYVTGNLNIEDNILEWTYKNPGKTPIRGIGYSHFEYDINERLRVNMLENDDYHFIPTMQDHIKYKSENPRLLKAYNFLCKKPRQHRMWFFNELREWDLLKDGIITMTNFPYDSILLDNSYHQDKDKVDACNKLLPMYAYDDDVTDKEFKYYMYNFTQQAILDSFLTVVPETHFDDSNKATFLSEKTFKVIASHSPFIILGGKHSLRKLQNMGYKTFNGFINESYDHYDSLDRIEAIRDEIRNFVNREDKMQWLYWIRPKLEYNRNILNFNALFNPPTGFHLIKKLLSNDSESDI